MFIQRVITAVILLTLVVLLVLLAPTWLLALVAGLMTLVGSWEWAGLSGKTTITSRITTTVLMAVLLCVSWLLRQDGRILWSIAMAGFVWWLFAIFWVFWWRHQFPSWVKIFCGILTLMPAWVALVALHASQNGKARLLFLLVLIWSADIGAYAAGRLFGKYKLALEVSPGKTWEGVVGGTLSLLAVAFIGVWTVPSLNDDFLILICLITGWLSIVGDLSESLFKRQAGVKDSGMLLPGHGGVLDRIDSLTAALPVFWLGLAFLDWLR